MRRIILIFAAVGLISCNTAEVGNKGKSLIPLGQGYKWEYEYDVEANPKSISFEVTNIGFSQGQAMATFDSFPCLGRDLKTEIIVRSDRSYIVSSMMGFLFIPSPEKIKTGYKWESKEWKCTIASDKEDVEVFGKNYKDCVHITFSASITFWGEMWLKEGVGIVKWQFLRTNPPTTELGHYLLKTYSIK